eukprot:366540-Chlamydomonas_euryale.AAC.6
MPTWCAQRCHQRSVVVPARAGLGQTHVTCSTQHLPWSTWLGVSPAILDCSGTYEKDCRPLCTCLAYEEAQMAGVAGVQAGILAAGGVLVLAQPCPAHGNEWCMRLCRSLKE